MSAPIDRAKVLQEIDLIPEDKLPEVYNLLHYFRLGLEADQDREVSVMRFAGCWKDMPEEAFTALARPRRNC